MRRASILAVEATAAFSLVACTAGTHAQENPQPPQSSAESTATPRLQALAQKIVTLHNSFPSVAYDSKPPYTAGVILPLDGGGQLMLSTQTPTEKPDAKHPLTVDVQQSGIEGGSFDATFFFMGDGLWTAICSRNDGQNVEEEDQKAYEIDGANRIQNPAMANAILQNMLTGSENVVGSAADYAGQPISPFKDVCGFNLGDGDQLTPQTLPQT